MVCCMWYDFPDQLPKELMEYVMPHKKTSRIRQWIVFIGCIFILQIPISGVFANRPPTSPIQILSDGRISTISASDIYHQRFTEQPVTQGIRHFSFERYDIRGWIRGHVMLIDLQNENIETGLLYPDTLTRTDTLTRLAQAQGAAAAVNGDFFDIRGTRAPLGVAVQSGTLLKTSANWNLTLGVNLNQKGILDRLQLTGTVVNPSRPQAQGLRLSGINEHLPVPDGLMLFTPAWGAASRAGAAGSAVPFIEILIQNNIVSEIIHNRQFTAPLPADSQVLLARGTAVEAFTSLFSVNDPIQISYATQPDFQNLQFALSGDVYVVQDGVPQRHPSNPHTHPRTAAGFDRAGHQMIVAVIDGRSRRSRGMTYDELGEFMASLGAWNAINLDSGGSSQLALRPLGQTQPVIANIPSDGTERAVPNAIGFWTKAAPGPLAGFSLTTPDTRVFQGFTRTLQAHPYDTAMNPIVQQHAPNWSVDLPALASVSGSGILTGRRPGRVTASASVNGARGTLPLHMLGTPVTIYPSNDVIPLSGTRAASFAIFGKDALGYEALIEAADLTLRFDQNLLTIQPLPNGQFSIRARRSGVSALVQINAGSLTTHLSVGNTDPGQLPALPLQAAPLDPIFTDWAQPPKQSLTFGVAGGMRTGLLQPFSAHEALFFLQMHQPEFVLLNGNFVTQNTAAAHAAAKTHYDQALPAPYYTVPGRHEFSGANTLQHYRAVFGEDYRQFDQGGVRFILLNTARGSLRLSNPEQWHHLRKALEEGKTDPAVTAFVLAAQNPIGLPPLLRSGYDENEGMLLQEMLTEVYEETGKRTLFVSSGASGFSINRVRGVVHIDTGLARSPRAAVITLDPAGEVSDWLKVKLTP